MQDQRPRPLFMRLLRDLVEAYQAFEAYAQPHIKAQGLTPAQFDVLATLGNTDGLTFKVLGQRTLIYKTTLTSVVDRLEARGLVRRRPADNDRRSTVAELTDEGHRLFAEVFPAHSEHLRRKLEQLSEAEMQEVRASLARLRNVFD
ncbi:MarR family transcriptional regulator [Methylonatrum kenyense]|uniref:MarR family winged helix-turn-helix transcriptional regulator n=1 Tax=Methylonatrum kenyense TaxID=455253 RepID=UPI0020C040E8|nr:MarR family transcriptional regulator [Methylonatrum kenyense]MCK8515746.1 MarR family transcriptional regulator [Methylonatrum kenyense]